MYCALCAENKSEMNFKKIPASRKYRLRASSSSIRKKKVFTEKKSFSSKTQIIGLNRQIILVLFKGYIQMYFF